MRGKNYLKRCRTCWMQKCWHRLSISKAGAYQLLNRSDFPILQVGGRKLVTKQKLALWMEQHTNTQKWQHRVRKPPQREVPGILCRTAGYLPIAALLIRYFKILPCAPRHTIPDQFQKNIIVYQTVIFIRPQHLIGTAWEVQISRTLADKLLRRQ